MPLGLEPMLRQGSEFPDMTGQGALAGLFIPARPRPLGWKLETHAMARKRTIYITEFDLIRLNKLIEMLEEESDIRDKKYIEELDDELRRAKVVAPKSVPNDVITMNSKVRVKDLDSGRETIYQLVFPGDADIKQNKISILAPVGTALIGFRVGETLEWKAPAGVKAIRVEEILYQPEAAGDYHL
jgi:regulator of nucleoside diphosphate kinase